MQKSGPRLWILRTGRGKELTREVYLEAKDSFDAIGRVRSPINRPGFSWPRRKGSTPGVIGLAASRIMEEFYRPSAVVAIDGELARGSIRSVPGFHITEALNSCSELLERFGGHAAAAGFTIRAERLPELRRRLERLAGESLSQRDPQTRA